MLAAAMFPLTMEPQKVPDSDLHQILNIIRVDQLKFSEKTSGTEALQKKL
jgi:hypothetical protein